MKEKVIKSPHEQGEYLISQDVMDKQMKDGKWIGVDCYSVFFRKDGIEDWESVKTLKTMREAEAFVRSEKKWAKRKVSNLKNS